MKVPILTQPLLIFLILHNEQSEGSKAQRARYYLTSETAVVLELEPSVMLANQRRTWRLAQRLVGMPNVAEVIPGMNNITVILRNPESLALDAIECL